ncbi:MAG: hypothetical protein UY61_C0019G0012 [Candidatus Adlerbacteria bacterium GW2011_GWC1_50_9]|uniref:SsrA-binding protein n=1 Tax=Candidatus Adlerbacteria bacterium GW2011_GWC1_50_9 TaxID=1618608 RepID=A0A0G1ZNA7_9BACT|nr:MAG: hypothetical protein UY61_C0019G0012 [Candidatus Adlerbacteria bacterium GW2011_GWC1_50_9]
MIQWGYPMPELSSNKRARFDYEILKEYEAGIELFGFEVKSIKDHRMSIAGAFVVLRGGEAGAPSAQVRNSRTHRKIGTKRFDNRTDSRIY